MTANSVAMGLALVRKNVASLAAELKADPAPTLVAVSKLMPVETLMLARSIAVLHAGRIVEQGDPLQLYTAPQRAETMRYVGFPQANFVEGKVVQRDGHTFVETPLFTVPANSLLVAGQTVAIGVRPEHINLTTAAPADTITGRAKVLLREDLGGEEIVYLDVAGHQLTTVLRSDDESQAHVNIDQLVTYWLRPTDLVVYVDGQRNA